MGWGTVESYIGQYDDIEEESGEIVEQIGQNGGLCTTKVTAAGQWLDRSSCEYISGVESRSKRRVLRDVLTGVYPTHGN